MQNQHTAEQRRVAHLRKLLQQAVLLRETGPKSAAWHRARKQTIWRLHALLEERPNQEPVAGEPR